MDSVLYIVYSEQQLLEAVLIHLKNSPSSFLFLAEERVYGSAYLTLVAEENVSFFKETDYPRPNFWTHLMNVGDFSLLPKTLDQFVFVKIFNGSRYQFLSELVFNKFPKALYYELDDGLATSRLNSFWLNRTPFHIVFDYIKKIIKTPLIFYVFYIKKYELFTFNFNYLQKKGKVAVRWFPEIENSAKIPVVSLFSLINQGEIGHLGKKFLRDEDFDKSYFFLSYDTEESSLAAVEDRIYVGHPRVDYSSALVTKKLTSDLIAMHCDLTSQPSSLILVFLFSKKYLKSNNVLTINNGELLVAELKKRTLFVSELIERREIIVKD